MNIAIEGLGQNAGLRALIQKKVGATLNRFHVRGATARVRFADDNGPKGGPAIRCTATVEVPRRGTVQVMEIAETPRAAFAGGLAALERGLGRERERGRELARRPKKYFVAKGLLLPGEVTPAPARKGARRKKRARAT